MTKAIETLAGADAATFRTAVLAAIDAEVDQLADHETRLETLEGAAYTDEKARDAAMAMLVGAGLLVETENDAGDVDTFTVNAASAADVKAGASNTKAITPAALAGSAAAQTLADGATITWDMSLGYNAKVTLGGNRTLGTPTSPVEGLTYTLAVIQDATGSRTLTWPASFDWGTTGAPTLTTTAGKVDQITLQCTDAVTPKFRAYLSGKGFAS